jgi:sulfate transport system ATP-binding protein
MNIRVERVSKRYGTFEALKEVNLDVPAGKITALLGPSGSGKTTLLRLMAGLEIPDRGHIFFGDRDYTATTVRERRVGFVFQHYALFRHMTVFENIAFGLKVRPRKSRPSKKEIEERVYELLRLIQLEGYAHRFPAQLSGGQRQRVALARALAVEPEVLLLDEPFGALDAKVRQELRRWLRELHDQLPVTTVFVTHDQEEALEVADRVVVMNEGRIEQTGTPHEVYHHPKTPFVYRFLGRVNLFQARVEQDRLRIGEARFELPPDLKSANGETVAFIRPHEVRLSRTPGKPTSIQAEVYRISTLGPVIRLEMKNVETGELIEAELSLDKLDQLNVNPGEIVYADLEKARFFPYKGKYIN